MFNRSLVMVHDQPQPCPYISEQEARMPLCLATKPLTAEELDDCLAAGYRRSGLFLYRTQCVACQACEPTRVAAVDFQISRSQRRVLKRGDRIIRVEMGSPKLDQRRIELLNEHRCSRQLALNRALLDADDYRSFLVEACCDTREFSYWIEDHLVAVAIVDFGATSLSAVYCYFDPQADRFSLGTYSILKQLELALETGRKYVYLGMYVASNQHLNYKANFKPQQRLIGGEWKDIPADSPPVLV
ncbi:arginyltransferase [Planctomycetaceae bacterium SH139]